MRGRRWMLACVACVGIGCGSGQGEDGSVGTDSSGDPDAPLFDSLSSETLDDTGSTEDTEIDSTSIDSSDVADTAPALDSATDTLAEAATDAASDSGGPDGGAADTKPLDTGADTDTWTGTAHVHVYISNTCDVSTSPMSFDVPAGKTLKLSWHNHSVDYRADLWGSYGGGYLMLEKGATWNEPYEHCFIKSTHTEYMDVSPEGSPSGCGKFRLNITCHAP
ncbi:MAG: hypothetical protein ACXVEE_34430 [Polyangiales bacterium]